MCTNQEFLEKVIQGLSDLDSGVNQICATIKDVDSKIVYYTPTSNEFFELGKEVIGMLALPGLTDEHQKETYEEEREVIKYREKRISFNIHQFPHRIVHYICSKYPIINPSTNDIVGIYCFFERMIVSSLNSILLRAHKIYEVSDVPLNVDDYDLTRREKQAVFLFLSGMSSADIALVISKLEERVVTKSTIDSLFAKQLLVKFKVYSREALFRKLFHLGFFRYVPKDLFINIKIRIFDLNIY